MTARMRLFLDARRGFLVGLIRSRSRPKPCRPNRTVISTITPAWSIRRRRCDSTNSWRNSSAKPPIRSWSRFIRTMQSESSVEDYTQRIAQTWGVGQKGTQQRRRPFRFRRRTTRCESRRGYGLEGALPDATCFDITHNVIAPHFKKGDYAGGLGSGHRRDDAGGARRIQRDGKTHDGRSGKHASGIPIGVDHISDHLDFHYCSSARRAGAAAMVTAAVAGHSSADSGGGGGWSAAAARVAAGSVDLAAAAAALAAAAPVQVGKSMRTKDFLKQARSRSDRQGDRAAEAKTSGEIRVYIHRGKVDDAVAAGQREISEAGHDTTRERNAVLIFVAPRAQKFAVIGDEGVHQRCGDGVWAASGRDDAGTFPAAASSPTAIVEAIEVSWRACWLNIFPAPDESQRTAERGRRERNAYRGDALAKAHDGVYSPSRSEFLTVAPLVPGFPSLDAKPRSPGGTRRFERKKSEGRRMKCRQAFDFS